MFSLDVLPEGGDCIVWLLRYRNKIVNVPSCVPSCKVLVVFCVSEPLSPWESGLARDKDSHKWLLPGLPDSTPLSDLYSCGLCSLPAESTSQWRLEPRVTVGRGQALVAPWPTSRYTRSKILLGSDTEISFMTAHIIALTSPFLTNN